MRYTILGTVKSAVFCTYTSFNIMGSVYKCEQLRVLRLKRIDFKYLILHGFILQNFVYEDKTWFSNFISGCKIGKRRIKYVSLEHQWSLFCDFFLIFHSRVWKDSIAIITFWMYFNQLLIWTANYLTSHDMISFYFVKYTLYPVSKVRENLIRFLTITVLILLCIFSFS